MQVDRITLALFAACLVVGVVGGYVTRDAPEVSRAKGDHCGCPAATRLCTQQAASQCTDCCAPEKCPGTSPGATCCR